MRKLIVLFSLYGVAVFLATYLYLDRGSKKSYATEIVVEASNSVPPVISQEKHCEARQYKVEAKGEGYIKIFQNQYADLGEKENFIHGLKLAAANWAFGPDFKLTLGTTLVLPCMEELEKVEFPDLHRSDVLDEAFAKAKELEAKENTTEKTKEYVKIENKKISSYIPPAQNKIELVEVSWTPEIMASVVGTSPLPKFISPKTIEETDTEWPGEYLAPAIPTNVGPAASVKTVPAKSPPKYTKERMHYQVVVHIPEGALEGVQEGTFPAQLVENQDKHGNWRSREDMSVTVNKVVLNDGNTGAGRVIYDNFITLDKKPTKNSSVAIDFRNGSKPVQITSAYLLNGEMVQVKKLGKMKHKAYKTLNAFFPKRPSLLTSLVWRPVRPFIPIAMQSGLAIATGNPMALAYTASSFARGRVERSVQPKPKQEEEPPLHVQYALASEADTVNKLASEIESLKVKLDFMLRQQEDFKTAQNGHGGVK